MALLSRGYAFGYANIVGIIGVVLTLLALFSQIPAAMAGIEISGTSKSNPASNSATAAYELPQSNLTEASKKYMEIQRQESLGPRQIIDMEELKHSEFSEEALESYKEDVKRGEAQIEKGKLVSIQPRNIAKLNFSTPDEPASAPNKSSMTTENTYQSNDESDSKISVGWNGLDIKTANLPDRGPVPPDVALGVGPNHVVQMVHSAMRVWDKSGNILDNFFLADFFGTGTDIISDPLVMYDQSTQRWFAAIMDIGAANSQDLLCTGTKGCGVIIAVSSTDDPLGIWSKFFFPSGQMVPDQPIIATSNDKFVISVNGFYADDYAGPQILIADKQSLINGITSFVSTNPDSAFTRIYPAHSLTPSDCMYFVSAHKQEGGAYSNPQPTSSMLKVFSACGNPTKGNLEFVPLPELEMARAYVPPSGIQPGTDKEIDTGDMRITTAVYHDEVIWTAFNTACSPEGGIAIQSCMRLQRIDPLSNKLLNDTNVGVAGHDMLTPALTINGNGQLRFLAGLSGSNLFPSLAFGDESLNLTYVVVGSSADESSRYGDYFNAATDPVDGSVWLSGQYGDSRVQGWSTYVANVK